MEPAGSSAKHWAGLCCEQFNSYSAQHARFISTGNCSFNCTVSFMGYAPGCVLYARHFSIYGQSYPQNFKQKVKPAKYALPCFHKYLPPISLFFFPMKLNESVKPVTQTLLEFSWLPLSIVFKSEAAAPVSCFRTGLQGVEQRPSLLHACSIPRVGLLSGN